MGPILIRYRHGNRIGCIMLVYPHVSGEGARYRDRLIHVKTARKRMMINTVLIPR